MASTLYICVPMAEEPEIQICVGSEQHFKRAAVILAVRKATKPAPVDGRTLNSPRGGGKTLNARFARVSKAYGSNKQH